MSLSGKRAAKLTAIAVILVSLFAATAYYAIPDGPRTKTIAFALGPHLDSTNANSSLYSLIADLNVTFQNGTTWNFYNSPSSPFGNYVGAAELNSTDIKEIQLFPTPGYSPGLDLQKPFWAAIEYAADWGIRTSLTGEETTNLGVLNAFNYTFGFLDSEDMSPPPGYRIPTLNYTLAVNGTGYWDLGSLPYGPWNWHINNEQIQDILVNTTGPANVSFDLDLSMNVYYQVTTEDGTQMGNAIVGWSGRWGTLQLLNDGDKLIGLRYSFSEISLRMMAT